MDGAKVNRYAALVMGWFLISRVWVFGKCHREMGLKGKFYRGQKGDGAKKGLIKNTYNTVKTKTKLSRMSRCDNTTAESACPRGQVKTKQLTWVAI